MAFRKGQISGETVMMAVTPCWEFPTYVNSELQTGLRWPAWTYVQFCLEGYLLLLLFTNNHCPWLCARGP